MIRYRERLQEHRRQEHRATGSRRVAARHHLPQGDRLFGRCHGVLCAPEFNRRHYPRADFRRLCNGVGRPRDAQGDARDARPAHRADRRRTATARESGPGCGLHGNPRTARKADCVGRMGRRNVTEGNAEPLRLLRPMVLFQKRVILDA